MCPGRSEAVWGAPARSPPAKTPLHTAMDTSVSTQPARGFPSGNAEFPSKGPSLLPGWVDIRAVRTGQILAEDWSIPSRWCERGVSSRARRSAGHPRRKMPQREELGQQERKMGGDEGTARGRDGCGRGRSQRCTLLPAPALPAGPRRAPGTRWRPAQPGGCTQWVSAALLLFTEMGICMMKITWDGF